LSSLLFFLQGLVYLQLDFSNAQNKLEMSWSTNRYFTLKISLSVLLNKNYYFSIALQLLKNIDETTNQQSAITF
jgi:hypothetical protein